MSARSSRARLSLSPPAPNELMSCAERYGQKQLYGIVTDILSYPQFIPYCKGARILSGPVERSTELETQAELEIGFLGVRERYTSRVLARPFRSVQASAIGGDNPMFKTLVTTWRFEPVPAPGEQPSSTGAKEQAGPTLLTLDLEYSFLNPLHAALAGAFFEKVSGMMVDAFERRCEVVYGPGKSPVTPDAVKMREVELVQK
ncbi:hypothetical protein CALCODRAFT_465105 [Calocera cornea HHB12733]|uniref:Coenzyme Q-binding protein COQ10 START domain-containing protein n=1 Tax=Calocera cornea HHB12733 TaxID=1353952 RepID=A0A165IP75_9BASI|nr:hypothetical protein CALCODRAFT_465105 [Calocera cornea HHB12733]